MKETTKIVSQQEALKKYQNYTHRNDGTCEVRVRLNDDGTEDPSCWNMRYRNEQERKSKSEEKPKKESKKEANKESQKKNKHSDKGIFGEFKGLGTDLKDTFSLGFGSSDDDDEDDDDYTSDFDNDDVSPQHNEYYYRNGRELPHGPLQEERFVHSPNVFPYSTNYAGSATGPFERISKNKDLLQKIMTYNYNLGKDCHPSGINKTLYGIIAMLFLPAFFFKCSKNDLSTLGYITFVIWLILLFAYFTPYAWITILALIIQIAFGIGIIIMPQNIFDYLFIYTKNNCG